MQLRCKLYQQAICLELQDANIRYVLEETIPIMYKGQPIGGGHYHRLDIAIHPGWLPFIFELKSESNNIKSKHQWQLIRYMISKNFSYGAVINFNQSP